MIPGFLKSPLALKIYAIILIPLFGLTLINLFFFLDFVYQTLLRNIIGFGIKGDILMEISWLPSVFHLSYLIILGIVAFFTFRSNLPALFKATFLTTPIAFLYATIGILTYSWPVVPYLICGLIFLGLIYYFYRKQLPWFYYYSLTFITLALGIFTLAGGEI